jgi:hypothetical protein
MGEGSGMGVFAPASEGEERSAPNAFFS